MLYASSFLRGLHLHELPSCSFGDLSLRLCNYLDLSWVRRKTCCMPFSRAYSLQSDRVNTSVCCSVPPLNNLVPIAPSICCKSCVSDTVIPAGSCFDLNFCSGHGSCNLGSCECVAGYGGADCSHKASSFPLQAFISISAYFNHHWTFVELCTKWHDLSKKSHPCLLATRAVFQVKERGWTW